MNLLHLRARWYSPESATFLSKDTWEGNYQRPQSLNGWNYVEGNPINAIDPTGLYKYQIWVSAFIAPSEVEFPYPYSLGTNLQLITLMAPNYTFPFRPRAFWEGDNRGYYTGDRTKIKTASARIWHWIEIDTDPSAKQVTSANSSGADTTRVRYQYYPGGPFYILDGHALSPTRATVFRDLAQCRIKIYVRGIGPNPLTPSGATPAIDYEYNFTFDTKSGRLYISGTHDPYPAHEIFVRSNEDPLIIGQSEIEAFSPYTILGRSPGSGPTYTPLDLDTNHFGVPQPVHEVRDIQKHPNCQC